MTSTLNRRRVVAGLAGLPFGLSLTRAAPVAADKGSGSSGTRGDFALSVNYGPPAVGFLVRGGLRLADCPQCTTDIEPRYVRSSFGETFFDSNSLGFVSLNDFEGAIALEIRHLPPGVTSQTATSVNLKRRNATSTPLRLSAASDAPRGDASITVRATSGALVHTLDLPISVVDQMPTS